MKAMAVKHTCSTTKVGGRWRDLDRGWHSLFFFLSQERSLNQTPELWSVSAASAEIS